MSQLLKQLLLFVIGYRPDGIEPSEARSCCDLAARSDEVRDALRAGSVHAGSTQFAHQILYPIVLSCILLAGSKAACQTARRELDESYRAALLSAENVVLLRPNLLSSQAVPLGNGSLGIAVWSENGLTLQLNRADTMPNRLSPGKVVVPGLARLTSAADYKAYLDLYNGEFFESGGGMTLRLYVEPHSDAVVMAVTGAPAGAEQTACLTLWSPRNPRAIKTGLYGALAETWNDDTQPGASQQTFGSVAAIRAIGGAAHLSIKDSRTVELRVKPDAHGNFTLRIAAPKFNGSTSPDQALRTALKPGTFSAHRAAWHQFWSRTALIDAHSPDSEAEYMANLRDLYLFYASAERGTDWPGSQAGIADLLSAVGDAHRWDPAAFWHWNLRMMTAANLSAGVPGLNLSYFALYRNAVSAMQKWTLQHMQQRPGICVPETMRFNGPGYEFEQWDEPITALNCAMDSPPYYNARTLSTGAEVSLWIFQQYLATDDLEFLSQNYPLMRESSLFLLSYQQLGPDGLLHTSPSNAHETQWDVKDPTTDLAAIRTLFKNTVSAAALLHRDDAMVKRLHAALQKLPALPFKESQGKNEILSPADVTSKSVISDSYLPGAPQHNVENIGLEPIWPYGLVGADGKYSGEAKQTFYTRPYPTNQDWSNDPIQAARLGLGAEVASTLAKLTEKYQIYPNGLASWGGNSGEFYIEQAGVVADALSEALVQDYDGVIRLAPAVPADWSMSGSVAIRHRSTVSIRVERGAVQAATIAAGSDGPLRVLNPWGSAACVIVDRSSNRVMARGTALLNFTAIHNHKYSIRREDTPTAKEVETASWPQAAAQPRRFGSRTIGLAPEQALH